MSPATSSASPSGPGLRFTETMRGFFSADAEVTADYERAAARGREEGSRLEFTLTIETPDLEAFLEHPRHEAEASGTVEAPALSSQPLTVEQGRFNLFVEDPDDPRTRKMLYRLELVSAEGERYLFDGFKVVRDDLGVDLWTDTTTLFVTLHPAGAPAGAVLGRGILTLRPSDLRRQLATVEIPGATSTAQRLYWKARFGQFFAGVLDEIYGDVFARATVFDPEAPPRPLRPLRVEAPEVFPLRTPDGVELRLIRHRGGEKGPVILSHGLGVSSKIFTIDTIETNLLEYLHAHGYDVWLLDYRASIELRAARRRSTGDDVATRDYPVAVAKVRETTGADSVQMVVHCFGATTFMMAMLAGLEGVRSAVVSQIATDIKAPALTRLKTGLHVPELLDALGVDSLDAYVDTHRNWWERLYDGALRLWPTEHEELCTSPVCRRITFMYAPLYEHDQLNRATHDALHEMFGVANVGAFEHLGALVNAGKLVDAEGRDVYLPHLARLAIPIRFIHGAENACFLPESTELTVERLSEANGAALYSRRVVPGYGHIDCIFGRNAAEDVYPLMLEHLEGT